MLERPSIETVLFYLAFAFSPGPLIGLSLSPCQYISISCRLLRTAVIRWNFVTNIGNYGGSKSGLVTPVGLVPFEDDAGLDEPFFLINLKAFIIGWWSFKYLAKRTVLTAKSNWTECANQRNAITIFIRKTFQFRRKESENCHLIMKAWSVWFYATGKVTSSE